MKKHKGLKLILPFFFLLSLTTLFAQEVSNISFKQEGAQVVISYDLAGKEFSLYDATAYYSIDDGKTWAKLITIKGDLARISPGLGKTIYWDVLKDVTGIKGSISFKVETVKLKEKVYDKTGFLIAGEIIGGKVGYVGKKWGINGTFVYLPNGIPFEYDRASFYLSVTRNIVSKNKLKWNLGPSFGRASYFVKHGYGTSDFKSAVGVSNEIQYNMLYISIDIIYSMAEEVFSPVFPTLGVGIVF